MPFLEIFHVRSKDFIHPGIGSSLQNRYGIQLANHGRIVLAGDRAVESPMTNLVAEGGLVTVLAEGSATEGEEFSTLSGCAPVLDTLGRNSRSGLLDVGLSQNLSSGAPSCHFCLPEIVIENFLHLQNSNPVQDPSVQNFISPNFPVLYIRGKNNPRILPEGKIQVDRG